jgi:hypothetical protein
MVKSLKWKYPQLLTRDQKEVNEWHFQYWTYFEKQISHIINSSSMLVFEVSKGFWE